MYVQFYSRIPADYLEKISITDLSYLGVQGGGGYGYLKKAFTSAEVSSSERGEQFIRLEYGIKDSKGIYQKLGYKIFLTTTPCFYGGKRYWFLCLSCNKRVGMLYRRAEVFVCRHCNFLTYESKLLSGYLKGIGRIISINELEEAELRVKRTFYKGKPTKNFIRYENKKIKFHLAYTGHFLAIASKYDPK